MIDLSFLTEEEQDAILKVLQRDAALKRAEEERVRHLPEKIKDDQQLKNMSGQWFYEAKAKRHKDKIHGADIIRASMRRKRLPAAAEQKKDTAMRTKESWVNNVNKDPSLPPELAVVEEPEDDTGPAGPSSSVVDPASSMTERSQENARTPAVSLPKQRKNPFNNLETPEDHSSQQTKTEQSKTGKAGLFQISKEGELSESKEKPSIPDMSCPKSEKPKQPVSMETENASHIKAPIPKARKLIYKSNDLKNNDNPSFPGQRRDSLNARGAPRGILKRNSSSSSTDSETLRLNHNLDPKSKILSPGLTIHERISEKEHSLEDDSCANSLEPLKHVRFSAVRDDLPQSPRPVLGQEVGEFTVLESDRLQNGTEDTGDIDEFQDHPELSHKKPLSPYQSVTNPSVPERETEQPMSSGSVPSEEIFCHSDILPRRPQCVESSSIINEQDKSSNFTKLQSEMSKSPADELTQCVEPEPSQTSEHNFRDHRQGKPLPTALTDQTSSPMGPCATEIRKTTDDSISKVLDWFNRSSHTVHQDSTSTLQHLQGIDLRQQTDSKAQISNTLMTDNMSLKQDDSKVPVSTKIKLKPVRSDSMFQEEGDMPVSKTCQDSDALFKSNSENLSQQGTLKKGPDTLQRFERYRIPSHKNENVGGSQGSESTEEGVGTLPADSNYLLRPLKRSDSEAQVPWNTTHPSSLGKEKTKFHVPQKSKKNTHINADSSVIFLDSILKDDVERKSKTRNTSFLKPSLETEKSGLPLGTADSGSSWKKPEDQEEVGEEPKNQVLREKYKRVSDRISFWEGGKADAKAPQPVSSCSQESSSTKAHQPVKSQVMSLGSLSLGQSDYSQVTAKHVVFDGDDQTPHLASSSSSNKPETTRPPISGLSKNHPSGNQSDKVTLLQTAGNDPSLEKDRFLIDKSNGNFKVLSLRERMDEHNTELVYSHSQFENLRKFWGLGADGNSKHSNGNDTATNKQISVPSNRQKSKEFNTVNLSSEKTPEAEEGRHLRPGNVETMEEMEKLNLMCMLPAPPDETKFPQKTPQKFTYQLAGNEPSKENVGKNTECFVTPVIEKACSDQEIQESIVKTSVLPKVSKDMFSDRVQKLVAEATSPASQTSGKKVHEQQALKVGASENRTWPPKKSFVKDEEELTGIKESAKELQGRIQQDCSVDKLLKEATRTPLTPSQSLQEPVTTRPSSPPKEDLLFEKWIKENHSPSGDQRERAAPFQQGVETLAGTDFTLKDKPCNTEGMLQLAAEGSPPLPQPSQSFEGVSSSPADMSLSWDTPLRSQDSTLSSQKEISETIEKVILPSKPAMADINAVLQKLLSETGKVDTKLPERPSSPQRVSSMRAAPDPVVPNEDFHSLYPAPDRTHEGRSHLSARMSPSAHATMSPTSTVTQFGQELLQEVAETMRKTVIQPKSECPEFRAGLEKLWKETLQTSLSKDNKNTVTFSPSALTGSCETSHQLASSEFHPTEIQETVEKTEAPSVTESSFDAGLEKLLKEMSEGPCQLQLSGKRDILEKQTSQAEQAGLMGEITHPFLDGSGVSKMKVASSGLESQVSPRDKQLGGDEAVTGPLIDVQGYTGVFGVPECSQLYEDHKRENVETVQFVEDKGREQVIAGATRAPQKPGFEGTPKEMRLSRNKRSIVLETKGKATETSEVKSELAAAYKRQEKERGPETCSESEFSDGNTSSNRESWRNTSSSEEEHSPVLKTLERRAARKIPSKSLEDIPSDSSNQAKVDNLPEELVRSAEDVSTAPSPPDNQFSHLDKLKRMSKSVPAFLQDESDDRETDTASESSYQLRRYKKSPSSLTNLSSSSGMTSLSSASGSVMSVYSGDFGNLEVKGSVQFAIDYVESLKELHVFVAQCKDLAAADAKKQRSDPYVKTYLLPDKGKMGKKKTLVVKKTLNPVFNEILRYKTERQFLKTQKLNLSVWHRDTFKRNSFLGEVELDLETWDWDSKQNKQLKWYPLKRKTAPVALETENRGEMKLALQYVPEPSPGKKLPTTGEVHIWVKECLDLPLLRGSHLNSFVKCTILPDTSRKSRQKTRAVGKTTNPVFNHTMVYDGFRPEDLMEACVELTVWDHYKLTNQFLGGLRIGFGTGKSYGTEVDWMDSTSEEVALWEKMVNSPNTWVEAMLPLRMLLIAKISK